MTPLTGFLTGLGYKPIPLTRAPSGHLAFATAQVAGRTASLYLDTGAGQTVLDLGFARGLGLPLRAVELKGAGAGGGGLALFHAILPRLVLAEWVETEVPCKAMDLGHVNAGLRARGLAPMDGIIGGDLLQRREAVIDYRQSVLFLRSGAEATA